MILDTAFLLDLMDNDEGANSKARELESTGNALKLPTMALLELYIGVGAAMTDDEERRVNAILAGYPRVGMDEIIATRAGRMIGELDPSVYKRKKGDAVIAATADVEGEPVVTRNVDDFERYGVPVESY